MIWEARWTSLQIDKQFCYVIFSRHRSNYYINFVEHVNSRKFYAFDFPWHRINDLTSLLSIISMFFYLFLIQNKMEETDDGQTEDRSETRPLGLSLPSTLVRHTNRTLPRRSSIRRILHPNCPSTRLPSSWTR